MTLATSADVLFSNDTCCSRPWSYLEFIDFNKTYINRIDKSINCPPRPNSRSNTAAFAHKNGKFWIGRLDGRIIARDVLADALWRGRRLAEMQTKFPQCATSQSCARWWHFCEGFSCYCRVFLRKHPRQSSWYSRRDSGKRGISNVKSNAST